MSDDHEYGSTLLYNMTIGVYCTTVTLLPKEFLGCVLYPFHIVTMVTGRIIDVVYITLLRLSKHKTFV